MVTLAFKRRQLGGGPKATWLKGLSSIMLVNRMEERLLPVITLTRDTFTTHRGRYTKW
ncbi:hypothetical protein HNP81_004141 [Peribacillus huizhouensis]|uniref:Uncharacterized protein n=1 Tax=Peribacillus huizhouensis TaxID=1501239 RepID=A0ABR6CV32_9BACI|nr:hypothetical protein [Peribacillus huizhouensis]